MESYEELSFGKIGENNSDLEFPDKYIVFHEIINSKFGIDPGKNIIGISYDNLISYLAGASLGKAKNKFYLYNGISSKTRGGWYPNIEFLRLDKEELIKLLNDSYLDNRFPLESIRYF